MTRYGETKGGKGDQSCPVPKGDASLIVIPVSLTVALDKSFIKIGKSENQCHEDKRWRSRKSQGGGWASTPVIAPFNVARTENARNCAGGVTPEESKEIHHSPFR
jgi:hypothetical protein